MRSSILVLLLLPAVSAHAAVSPDEIAKWLRDVAIETPGGRTWPDDARTAAARDVDLGTGSSGVVLFWIAMHQARPDGDFLDDVRRGADYLAAHARTSIEPAFAGEWTTGLYGPLAGPAFALNEAWRLTGDGRHRAAAMRLVEVLHASAERDASGASWGDTHDVLTGAAGTGLFLLYAAREMDHPKSLALAMEVGRKLIVRGVPEPAGGMTWKASYEGRFVLPNFSHGAAGIAYFLASLYEATGEQQFLDAARAGAESLKRTADRTDGGFRLLYGWPDPGWARPYDIGWAHGPAGTARLFQKLWILTGEESWRELVRACARSLRLSGLPSEPKPEYGSTFDFSQRFGMAGAARFFLDLYESEGDPADLEFARQLVEEIRREPRWKIRRYGFMERSGEKGEFTGYFYGAAGYGLLLLGLQSAIEDRPWTLRLPDDPFEIQAPLKSDEPLTGDPG